MPNASLNQYIFSRGVIASTPLHFYILDYDLKLPIYSLAVVITFLERDAECGNVSLLALM